LIFSLVSGFRFAFDLTEEKENAGWSMLKSLKAHESGVNAISWAPYQQGGACRIVSGGSDNTVKIWTFVS